MQDLLNEQEFLKQKYNPWKLFYTFYAIAFIQLILFMVVLALSGIVSEGKTAIAVFLLPNITAFVMFFFNKKTALLPYKTIALGTGILFAVYSIPMAVLSVFGGTPVSAALGFLFLAGIDFSLCFLVMYFIAKQKKASANS
jgi:hypothetical protein